MVKCKTCGADIAKSAKVCPKCGAKQKKSILLWVVIAIFSIGVIGAATGGSDDEPKKVNDSKPSQSQQQAGANKGTPSEKPSEEQKVDEQTVFGVGEKAELKDVVVTLNAVTESTGSQFNKPTDGNIFILCEFTIENNSNKELNISSILCFDGYIDDYSASPNFSAQLESDKGQLDGTVASGRKMNGMVGFEGPVDWKKIEVRFTPSFWNGNEITFLHEK